MNRKELSQCYWLEKEIDSDEERLAMLRHKVMSPKAQQITGMPRGGGDTTDSQMERLMAEIVDLEAIILAKRMQCIHQRQRIERFIAGIDDSMTRLVLTLRCIEGFTWREVAAKMGSKMTEENAKQIYSRYIRNAQRAGKLTDKSRKKKRGN